jgi:acetyl esterase/lipase
MQRYIAITCFCCLLYSSSVAADQPVIDVWPGRVPGETKEIGAEEFRAPRDKEKADVKRLSNVSKPTLTVFQPAADKRNGAAVIVCPGGGYNILAWDLEGTEVAEWLNSIGVTAFVLKYRVPRRENYPNHEAPLMDGQRAVSLVRSKASECGLDPGRIGMLGLRRAFDTSSGSTTSKTPRTKSPAGRTLAS